MVAGLLATTSSHATAHVTMYFKYVVSQLVVVYYCVKCSAVLATHVMKHYRAKPSAQLSKHLQDDIKHAVIS